MRKYYFKIKSIYKDGDLEIQITNTSRKRAINDPLYKDLINCVAYIMSDIFLDGSDKELNLTTYNEMEPMGSNYREAYTKMDMQEMIDGLLKNLKELAPLKAVEEEIETK